MTDKPNYYCIIPAKVRFAKTISANAKLLYGEITTLCHQKGYCWASNDYFATLYGVSKTSISKWVNQLKAEGFITVELHYKNDSKEIDKRHIRLVEEPTQQKEAPSPTNVNAPMKEKFRENKTTNTKKNKTKNKQSALSYTDRQLDVAKQFKENVSKDFPKEMSEVNLSQWANDVRLMEDMGIEIKEIEEMVDWLKTNEFWARHIRNPKTLKNKFERLQVEKRQTKPKRVWQSNKKTESIPDWFEKKVTETKLSAQEEEELIKKVLAFQSS